MKKASCEIICVGTELLLGDIVNTNAQYISRGLARLGIDVFFETVVGDNPERLEQAVALAKGRADIIITTGGLGPTYDDLTKETVAGSFGRRLVMDEDCLRHLTSFFARVNRPMTENNRKQAMMPEGCIVLDNPQGTAPGCIIEGDDGKIAIMMPGPPREMEPMFDNSVAPYLRKLSDDILVSRVVRVIGIGESAMEMRLIDMMQSMVNPTIAPYAKSGECIVRITAKAHDEKTAYAMIDPVVDEIRKRLGAYAYGIDIDSLEQHIVELFSEGGMSVACAEMGTGGMAAKRIADVQGGGDVLRLGITSNSLNQILEVLDVREFGRGGVTDEPIAAASAMADGIRRLSGADIGIGIVNGDERASFAVADVSRIQTGEYLYPRGRDREYLATIAVNRAFDLSRAFAGIDPGGC